MNLSDYAQTTLFTAQQNTLASVRDVQVPNLNANLLGIFQTAFANWLANWNAGRVSDKSTAPTPPNAYTVGYFNDPTTGPGSMGPYGDTVVQWAYPALGTTPVC